MVDVQVMEHVMVKLAYAHAMMDLMEIIVKVSDIWEEVKFKNFFD